MPPVRDRRPLGLAARRTIQQVRRPFRRSFYPFRREPPPVVDRAYNDRYYSRLSERRNRRLIERGARQRRPFEREAWQNVVGHLRNARSNAGQANIPDNVARNIWEYI